MHLPAEKKHHSLDGGLAVLHRRLNMSWPLLVWALCGLLLPLGALSAAEAEPNAEVWDVLYMGKTRIGHIRSLMKTISVDGKDVLRTEVDTVNVMKRFGQTIKIRIRMQMDETPDGEFLGFETLQENPPADSTRKVARLVGEQLEMEITIAGKTTRKKLKWDPTVKSPAYQERLLKENPLKVGETREIKTFVPELDRVSTAKFTRLADEETTLFDGTKETLQRIDVGQSVIPGMVTMTFTNADGETLKTMTKLFGIEMNTFRVSKEEALKEISDAELDVGLDTLVKVGDIPKAHESKKIVYFATIPGADPVQAIPGSATQQLKSLGPDRAELTVTAAAAPPAGGGVSKPVDQEFQEPNRFLQSDDKLVIEHATKAVGELKDPWEQALAMEKYVHTTLKSKNFSTALASAAEVARDLQGDCTEHACLLAAMCRAKQIPSRVVVGLVYADRLEAFGGHMWTEVWLDGRWIPLDATLGRGGIGGGHIRLGDTSLNDDEGNPSLFFLPMLQVLGKLQLEVKSVE